MGKIKSKLIKRTAKTLVNNKELGFSDSFEKNKKVLGSTMPSKKLRNKIAGYLTRINKNEQEKQKKAGNTAEQ